MEQKNTVSGIEEFEAFLEKLNAADSFSGGILVAKDGIPLLQKAAGLADKSFAVANQIETKFNIGSIGKSFTAIAIAQLAERGLLSFNDPLSKWVPNYPRAVGDKITIHHLLTHTSGLGDFPPTYGHAWTEPFHCLDHLLPLLFEATLSFEPGSGWQYSNTGYTLLGAVIEAISGHDYVDHMKTHLYLQAGMYHTDAYEKDQVVANMAVGYTHVNPLGEGKIVRERKNLYLLPYKGGPAGGSYSTLRDLFFFERALRTHQLLSPTFTSIVLEGKVIPDPSHPDTRYAYGFADQRMDGKRVIWHNGGLPGYNAYFGICLELGFTVIVLTNCDSPVADQVASQAWRFLLEEKEDSGREQSSRKEEEQELSMRRVPIPGLRTE